MMNEGPMNIPANIFMIVAIATFDDHGNKKKDIADPIRQTNNINSGLMSVNNIPAGICIIAYAPKMTDDAKPKPVEVVFNSSSNTSVIGANEVRYTYPIVNDWIAINKYV